MEDLNSENKNYLLNTIKSKALELGSRPLKKFIDDDSSKPPDYNNDKEKINRIIAELYLKINTAKSGSPERQEIINNFLPSNTVTLRKPSTNVSSTVTIRKPLSDPDIVFTSNPLRKTEDDNLESEKLDISTILKYQLDVDQILYSKDSPELKKKQLMVVINNLKNEIKKFIDEETIDIYKEKLKNKLSIKKDYDIELIVDLFSPLIIEYFTSLKTINDLIPDNIKLNGGLSIYYIDSKEIQNKYKNELTDARQLQKILKNLEKEKKKQVEIQNKIDNKIKAINDAFKNNIALGDNIICTRKVTLGKIKQTGTITDINYIPSSKFQSYSVELLTRNEFGGTDKNNLSNCMILTPAIEEEEKKKQALIDEKTDFLSKQVASQYGFKIGDPINCTSKDGRDISGVAKKFKYNILKRKTYILIKETEKAELTQIDVKYCANRYDFTLKNINKLKEREYMKKQFKKLQEIIKKINKLNPRDENYEMIIKNLTNEYDIIESQINNAMKTSSESSSKCSDLDEECKKNASPKDNPDIRLITTEDERLKNVRKERIALLQLIQKINPEEYLKLNTILNRRRRKGPSLDTPGVGVAIGGKNTYAAELNQKNIKFKNGKLPILNTVKGGYNTFGLTQKYMQRAGNPDENINDIINNSNNLQIIMDTVKYREVPN